MKQYHKKGKKKFYISTTIASTLFFFKGQPRLWREDFEVCAIASEPDVLKVFSEEEGIQYKHIPMHREISLWSDFYCLLRFLLLFLKDRPYIVHGNTPKASLLSMVAAWFTRRPVRIYMCHGLRYQGTQGNLRKLLMMMEKLSCTCATHILCVSEGIADVMVKDRLCKKEKVKIIGCGSAGGVDMVKFNPQNVTKDVRNELNIPNDAFVFSFVGRIVKDKGINELVGAFSKLSLEYDNIHLLLVGPMESILNPIDNTSLDVIQRYINIHAIGAQKDVRPYLKSSNALVLPSYREGFGLVLIEAGAMGVPCITTNITGCNEIIVQGKNGAIVESRNQEALYNEMRKWIGNRFYVKSMANNARRMVEERYECHKVRNNYLVFYKSFLCPLC